MSDPVSRLSAALAGRYRIERQVGEGGMATVYLADDLRHERRVALKVLKPELVAIVGADRFLAEIKTTAALQHPHILPLFDSGEADGFLFYVMPFVEGESLRDRLEREGQLSVEDSVRIATQAAEALGHAHRHGVVHRDVKPANILLLDGQAVVADFGVSLAVGAGAGRRMTETGLSVGTPQYMSPEQATGSSNVGPASDVWSLGCVLYEMLAGEPPYGGSTPQAILGRIVTGRVEPVSERRHTTPGNVAAAIGKALEGVPSDRFATAEHFARALSDPRFRYGAPGSGGTRRRWLPAAGLTTAAYLLGLLTWSTFGPTDPAPVRNVRFIVPGLDPIAQSRSLALSRDGVYLAHASGGVLTVRRLDDSQYADTLAGTNVVGPFFSPDGEALAYFEGTSSSLRRVARTGGTPTLLATPQGARPRGGTWGDDGTIVFATTAGLYRVSETGGDVELLASPDTTRGELWYAWPESLPDRRAVLFTIITSRTRSDRDATIALIDLETRHITPVLVGGSAPRYLPSGPLVYSAGGALHATTFDRARGIVGSQRSQLSVGGLHLTDGWGADFDVSATGVLVYLPALSRPSTLLWRDREGREEPVPAPPGAYGYRRISPDGRRVAYDKWVGAGATRDIYVWDLARSTEIRLTDAPGEELFAEWAPGGDTLYYSSDQAGGVLGVRRVAADGSGGDELLFAGPANAFVSDVTGDGRGVIVAIPDGTNSFDLMVLRLDDPIHLDTLLATPASEYNAHVSPNGRAYAYQTDRDGRYEVWMASLVDPDDPAVKVSLAGGMWPTWSPAGDEIFFRSPDGMMMVAGVVTTPRLAVGRVRELFALNDGFGFGATSGRRWDVSPVDGRFLMSRALAPMQQGVRVELGWGAELRAAMAR